MSEIKLSEDDQNSENLDIEAKVYSQPKITVLGKIKNVTLGGSIGIGDSGGASSFCDPGDTC